jgi:hypothetical protein
MHFCVAHPLPPPTQFSNKRGKQKAGLTLENLEKRSEQKASKKSNLFFAFINTLRNGLSKSAQPYQHNNKSKSNHHPNKILTLRIDSCYHQML